jgi:hypothetical protein
MNPDENKEMIQLIMKFVDNMKDEAENKYLNAMKEYDVSESLTDDMKAKLQLLYGDCVIIPVDKIKEFEKKVS